MFSALVYNFYNIRKMVNVFMAFAPVTNISTTRDAFLSGLSQDVNVIQYWTNVLDLEEIMGASWINFSNLLCRFIDVDAICKDFAKFYESQRQWPLKDRSKLTNYDLSQRDGASYKQLIHLGQIIKENRFMRYDYSR